MPYMYSMNQVAARFFVSAVCIGCLAPAFAGSVDNGTSGSTKSPAANSKDLSLQISKTETLPIYTGAEVDKVSGSKTGLAVGTYSYYVDGTVDGVIEYYKKIFASRGWKAQIHKDSKTDIAQAEEYGPGTPGEHITERTFVHRTGKAPDLELIVLKQPKNPKVHLVIKIDQTKK